MVIKMQDNETVFDTVISYLPVRIKNELENIPNREDIEEIRIRADLPLCLTKNGESIFLKGVLPTRQDVAYCVRRFCNESVYAYTSQINSGFIAGPKGCRIGVAANFGGENAVDYSSLNIRIAKQIFGAANRLIKYYRGGGVLIAGPPGCGKTTVLRDAARQFSDGVTGKSYRVSVIDSRGEISGGGLDVGKNTDVFLFSPKDAGIEAALRSFSPEIICFDEIGTFSELKGVAQSLNAGANVFTTVHAESFSDFSHRPIIKALLNSGAVKSVILMHGKNLENAEFIEREELIKCRLF